MKTLRAAAAAATLLLWAQGLPASENPSDFFEEHVRPLLAQNCFTCHTDSPQNGLRLDSRESILKGGQSGPAILPGDPEASLLIQVVRRTHPRLKMPPGNPLSPDQVRHLETWVRTGAFWPEARDQAAKAKKENGHPYRITPEQRSFWSFQPIRKPATPETANSQWPRSAIDRFILARLESEGMQPVKPAGRRALIRRASLDLIGLPPTPEEVEAFVRDRSPLAFANVVDRLLASPHYGERWGRYWLDMARYADDRLNDTRDDPYPNAYRYRDWVVQALNRDLPYDIFVKAQIAGDLLHPEEPGRFAGGLGLYGLSPRLPDDRVDVTTRTFLGLTVACAKCHDHKYDPIPTRDFYSLQGVFQSTESHEFPLAPEAVVSEYQKRAKRIADLETDLKEFLNRETLQLGDILANQTSRFLRAARQVLGESGLAVADAARQAGLDAETLQRWINHLNTWPKEHPYLNDWPQRLQAPEEDFRKWAEEFQARVISVSREQRVLDRRNRSAPKGKPREVMEADKAGFWNAFYFATPRPDLPYRPPLGIYYYGEVNQYPGMEMKVVPFLKDGRREHVDGLLEEIRTLKESLPAKYAFLHAIRDSEKPADLKVHIGGSKDNLGETAPRRFLQILSEGEPPPFQKGSGRLELAEAIADPGNPLTARVMANRIWIPVRLRETGCGPGRGPAVVDGEPGLAQGPRRGARQVQPAGRVDPGRFQSAHPLRLRQPAASGQDHDPVRLPQSDRHQRNPLRDLHAPAAAVLPEQRLSHPAVGGAGRPSGQWDRGTGQDSPDLWHPLRPQPQCPGATARPQVSPRKPTGLAPIRSGAAELQRVSLREVGTPAFAGRRLP